MVRSNASLFLEMVPQPYRDAILSRLQPVSLPVRTSLYEPGAKPQYVHFLTSGIASIVASMSNGDSVEVGIWGHEGLVESVHMLGAARVPNSCFMQVEGAGLRMPFDEFQKEFLHAGPVQRLVLQCAQSQSLILLQLAACNRLHEVEERLARWLLMVQDRVEGDTIFLTQEFMAEMLGAQRTTVTLAAGTLQRAGLIEYRRGSVRILDRENLEAAACECYQTVRQLFVNFYG
jgi:CRP-like cAMP-binding protein